MALHISPGVYIPHHLLNIFFNLASLNQASLCLYPNIQLLLHQVGAP
jgi:hypothetical protein